MLLILAAVCAGEYDEFGPGILPESESQPVHPLQIPEKQYYRSPMDVREVHVSDMRLLGSR